MDDVGVADWIGDGVFTRGSEYGVFLSLVSVYTGSESVRAGDYVWRFDRVWAG